MLSSKSLIKELNESMNGGDELGMQEEAIGAGLAAGALLVSSDSEWETRHSGEISGQLNKEFWDQAVERFLLKAGSRVQSGLVMWGFRMRAHVPRRKSSTPYLGAVCPRRCSFQL